MAVMSEDTRQVLPEYRGTSFIRNRHPVGPCLGSYGGPRGGAVSYERGTPVALPLPERGLLDAPRHSHQRFRRQRFLGPVVPRQARI